jgi:fatty-acyl-CoA synthase
MMAIKINIGGMMGNRAYLSPDLEAFVCEGNRYTYKEANNRVNQFAYYLKEQLYPGDRVAILGKNRHQWVTAFYATAKADAITVPLNWRLHPVELAYLLDSSGATVLVYDSEFTELVDQLRSEIPVKSYVRIGGQGPDIEFEEVLAGRSIEEPRYTSGGEDTAILMYTSGTTGNPKGVMLTHNNMLFVTSGHCHTINWKYKDRFLSIAPLFHIGGLAPMLTNIHCGASCVFLADFNPVKVWELVVKEKITLMMTVPAMTGAMLQVPDIDKMDLSSLEHIVCGGSPVPQSIFVKYKELGVEVENVLGITEYAGAVTFWRHDMGWDKHTSVGKTVFHGDTKIVDPNTRKELPNGQTGEICVTGPQVFKGYWNNPVATSEVLVDGCYYSGDLGMKDDDGFIYMVDRLKDMIISGGENIYSAEIEAVIDKHPAVVEVAVVGKPDDKWGEIPVAFVVKAANAQLCEEDIIDLCTKNLAKFKCVKEVRFVDVLPRNAIGKLQKNILRSQFKSN